MMQIVWGHSEKAIETAKRLNAPLLVFGAFWDRDEAKRNIQRLDSSGLPIYLPEAQKIEPDGDKLIVRYNSDVYDIAVYRKKSIEDFEAIMTFTDTPPLRFLWDKSIIVDLPDEFEHRGEVEVLQNW